MRSSLKAHTPIRSREQGRAMTTEERTASCEAFDVALAAQALALRYRDAGYRYNERKARDVQFAALEFLEALDELVGV